MGLRGVMGGLRALLRREGRNGEIAAELRSFEEASIAEKMRRGMPREAAERALNELARALDSQRGEPQAAGP